MGNLGLFVNKSRHRSKKCNQIAFLALKSRVFRKKWGAHLFDPSLLVHLFQNTFNALFASRYLWGEHEFYRKPPSNVRPFNYWNFALAKKESSVWHLTEEYNDVPFSEQLFIKILRAPFNSSPYFMVHLFLRQRDFERKPVCGFSDKSWLYFPLFSLALK